MRLVVWVRMNPASVRSAWWLEVSRKMGRRTEVSPSVALSALIRGLLLEPNLYNNVQVIQSKDTAVIMTEMIHDARIVPLDNRPVQ